MGLGTNSAADRSRVRELALHDDVVAICTIGGCFDAYSNEAGNIPIVTSCTFGPNSSTWVGADTRDACRASVEYLLAYGHRQIALVCGPQLERKAFGLFAEAFSESFDRAGLQCPRHQMFHAYPGESLEQLARQLLTGEVRPTAVFAENWRVCQSILKVAGELGVRVPDDVSLVAFGRNVLQLTYPLAVTAYVPDYEQIGEKNLDGIFVPMFTPFLPGEAAINVEQLRKNTRFLIESGIRILNPAGTTGEFWTLTADEHRQVLQVCLDEAKSIDEAVIIAAGVSTPNLATTIEVAKFAVERGADLLQITPTYYLPMAADDVVAYYTAIGRAVDAPIMIYEIPPATGVTFNCQLLRRVCESCPNVIALKTATPAYAAWEFHRIVREFGVRLKLFAATGAYYSPFTYMSGAHGITDTLANAVPEFGLTLHRLARAKQWEEMNRTYDEAFDVLEIEMLYGRAGLKEIGNICGRNVGSSRYPMAAALSDSARADIVRRLSNWSLGRPLVK
jgi:4-hydroxy-tetrahydrodipicolinate synthase